MNLQETMDLWDRLDPDRKKFNRIHFEKRWPRSQGKSGLPFGFIRLIIFMPKDFRYIKVDLDDQGEAIKVIIKTSRGNHERPDQSEREAGA